MQEKIHGNRFDAITEQAARKFGKAVKEARKQLELTQGELGKIVGGQSTNIRQIECQGCSPKSRYFRPLCEELGLDPLSFGFIGQHLDIIEEWIDGQ
ncbi:MAG: helix-turn-helix transcriptional regulator [Selenomonadaceae bacterium]|nr:helix-turn-helix transcriptional regulator [Selenomonadaceae bacterium]